MEKFLIVKAKKEYVPQIAEIEKECFSLPWSEDSLLNEVENEKFCMFAAIEPETEKVIGWSGFSFIFDEAEVANIAVLKAYRGMGAGYALTKALLDEARKRNMYSLILEVRESNESARKIYKALGFREIAVRKNFYELPRENGISMIAELN